jgi:hypothetical protein
MHLLYFYVGYSSIIILDIQPGLFKDAVVELKQQLQVRSNAAEAAARLQAQESLPLLP